MLKIKKLLVIVIIPAMVIGMFAMANTAATNAATAPDGYKIVKTFDDIIEFQHGSPIPESVWENTKIYQFAPGDLDEVDAIQFHVLLTTTGSGNPYDFIELVPATTILPRYITSLDYPLKPDPNAYWFFITKPSSTINETFMIDLTQDGIIKDQMQFAGYATRDRYITITNFVGLAKDVSETSTASDIPTTAIPETTNDTTAASNPESRMNGDINGDGVVDAEDLLLLKKHVLNIEVFDKDSHEFLAADVNEDDTVDVEDLLLLKKYILKLIDEL